MLMNEYDITDAVVRWTRQSQPNRLGAALALQNLRDWTNNTSDGWCYWSKPSNATKALQEIANDYRAEADVTQADLDRAARSLKAFLTRMAKVNNRHGRPMVTADEREQILRSLAPVPA